MSTERENTKPHGVNIYLKSGSVISLHSYNRRKELHKLFDEYESYCSTGKQNKFKFEYMNETYNPRIDDPTNSEIFIDFRNVESILHFAIDGVDVT